VHIHDFDDEKLPAQLDRFIGLGFADACRYCAAPYDAPLVPAGKQT
jgi:hypothetical protein